MKHSVKVLSEIPQNKMGVQNLILLQYAASGSDLMLFNKINKSLVVYRFSNIT